MMKTKFANILKGSLSLVLIATATSCTDLDINDLFDFSDFVYGEGSEEAERPSGDEVNDEYVGTINIQDYYGCVTEGFYYDIKQASNVTVTEAEALSLYGVDGLTGIRCSIYGNYMEGGHPEPGVIDDSGRYSNVVSSIKNAQAACEAVGRKLTIFFSKRNSEGTFTEDLAAGLLDEELEKWGIDKSGIASSDDRVNLPFWVWGELKNTTNTEMYATMVYDLIVYLKENGIEMDYLGLINEEQTLLTPSGYIETVDYLREKLSAVGIAMPKLVAAEQYYPLASKAFAIANGYPSGYNGWAYWWDSFVNLIISEGLDISDYADVYGTHYYPHHFEWNAYDYMHKALEYEVTLADKYNIPFWATEVHIDNDSSDTLKWCEKILGALWNQTDLGLHTFMWWGFPTASGSQINSIVRAASLPLLNAQPITVDDYDGRDLLNKEYFEGTSGSYHRLMTRAFRNGNTVTLYIVNPYNNTDDAELMRTYKNYLFSLAPTTAIIYGATKLSYTLWSDDTASTGTTMTTDVFDNRDFYIDIPARSIIMVSFEVRDSVE